MTTNIFYLVLYSSFASNLGHLLISNVTVCNLTMNWKYHSWMHRGKKKTPKQNKQIKEYYGSMKPIKYILYKKCYCNNISNFENRVMLIWDFILKLQIDATRKYLPRSCVLIRNPFEGSRQQYCSKIDVHTQMLW